MKKIYLIVASFLVLASTLSCEDDGKDPWTIHEDANNFGTFVSIAKKTQVIDFTNPSSAYSFTVEAPGKNIASYDLSVTRTSGGVTSDPGFVRTVTSFPADLDITAADLAAALGLSASDLLAGDRFDFIATATGTDGSVAKFENLNGDGQGPGEFNAFRHNTFLSCPFDQAAALGTYATTVNEFYDLAAASFEVIAGPDENTVTIVNLYQDGFNFDMTVDADTGIATVKRTAVATSFLGYSGGNINTTATPSFFFSCTGTISAIFQHTVDLGSFGSYAFTAVKQ